MSFSYKTLSSNDITLTSYIANKQWEVDSSTFSQNGITVYVGENLPISRNYPFNPERDNKTNNDEYRRLIYNSIKHLFYQNYTSGSAYGEFYNSSSLLNFEQSTLESGSIRRLPNITGSNLEEIALYGGATYDAPSSLYDELTFDPDRGNKILIISFDQNVYGSGLKPESFYISSSTYHIQDDGEGNIYDVNTLNYIGNIFYSQGLVVITNEDYLCIVGINPVATNDYFSYLNIIPSQSFDITSNDLCDCGELIFSSFETSSIPGYTFPDFIYDNGYMNITENQLSVIPGNYKIGYTIQNSSGLISNTGSINLNITSQPLQIENIISQSACFNSTASLPVTFSINYGVPYYSYSLDEGNTWTGSSNLFNVTVSGSMTSSFNNIIYIKDYLGDILTQSFSSKYPEVTANIEIQKQPCSMASNGIIYISGGTAISASINSTSSALPATFTGISSTSYTIGLTGSFGCTTSSILSVDVATPLTGSITQSNVTCYGGSNGSLTININDVIDEDLMVYLSKPGTIIYEDVLLSSFINNSITASNLSSGSYTFQIYNNNLDDCQSYYQIINITSPTSINYNVSASYIDSCSNAIVFNSVTGGIPPYTYYAVNTGSSLQFSSTSSIVDLGTTNSGVYSTFIIDNNNCFSTSSLLEVYGRTYIYSGSSCEII